MVPVVVGKLVFAAAAACYRSGSIDGITEDANSELIWNYFEGKLDGGQFVVDADYFQRHHFWPPMDIEDRLACFERNITDYDEAAVLHGRPVVFALICQAIWDRLARSGPAARWSATRCFRHLFKDVPVAEEIYHGSLTKVSRHLRELSAVSNFLTGRGLAWRPPDNPQQDLAEEMRQYLEEAKRAFHDSAVMLEALKDYEREVGDLLEDD